MLPHSGVSIENMLKPVGQGPRKKPVVPRRGFADTGCLPTRSGQCVGCTASRGQTPRVHNLHASWAHNLHTSWANSFWDRRTRSLCKVCLAWPANPHFNHPAAVAYTNPFSTTTAQLARRGIHANLAGAPNTREPHIAIEGMLELVGQRLRYKPAVARWEPLGVCVHKDADKYGQKCAGGAPPP